MDPKTVWNKILHKKEQCVFYSRGLCILKVDCRVQIEKPEALACEGICEHFLLDTEKG